MTHHSFLVILLFSLIASFVTAFSYASTSLGHFDPGVLARPGVIQVASFSALILGFVFSPLGYWCLRDKNLFVVVPILVVLAFIIVVALCYIHPKVGLYGVMVYWIVALLIAKHFGPPLVAKPLH